MAFRRQTQCVSGCTLSVGYATWVVAATPLPPCFSVYSRSAHVRAMVYLTWAFVALSW